jgi:hypothetical protein
VNRVSFRVLWKFWRVRKKCTEGVLRRVLRLVQGSDTIAWGNLLIESAFTSSTPAYKVSAPKSATSLIVPPIYISPRFQAGPGLVLECYACMVSMLPSMLVEGTLSAKVTSHSGLPLSKLCVLGKLLE